MNKIYKKFFRAGAFSAGLAVALGAFGAHGLQGSLSPDMIEIYTTGVHYHLFHSLGILAAAWAYSRWHNRLSKYAGWAFILGIVLFSGSLYLLAITGIHWLGFLTPLGGISFILGWLFLGLSTTRADD